jgi:hypothetical protein
VAGTVRREEQETELQRAERQYHEASAAVEHQRQLLLKLRRTGASADSAAQGVTAAQRALMEAQKNLWKQQIRQRRAISASHNPGSGPPT